MKRIVASLLTLASAIAAYSQGQINFTTRVLSSSLGTVNAPIYGPQVGDPFAHLNGPGTNVAGGTVVYTGPLLAGTGFTAALYSGPAGATALELQSTATFRTAATLLGYITPPNPALVTVTNVGIGSMGTFEMRVWDNRGGTVGTWAAVMADPSIARGQSGAFTPPFPLGGTIPGNQPITPPNLAGLNSFNIAPVPEPGVIALGVLGLGALLLRRRK